MNLFILGAAGATGSQVVQQAVSAGHTVTALVRSPDKMAFADDRLRIVQGDATDEAAVAKAMAGADAVISTLGGSPPVMSNATRTLLAAVNAQKDAPGFIMLSSFAVERDRLKGFVKLVSGMVMGAQIKDKTVAEQAVRASALRWTIVYATRLSDGPRTGMRVVPEADKVGVSDTVSRADVASFLLAAATDGTYDRRAVIITGV
jgi:putative NADH-flavin reductase